MLIVPAIDIIDGSLVRLTKGDYATKKDYGLNIVDVAKMFEDTGITHLHMVDLDGAKKRETVHYSILEAVASKTSLHIDFSGGIKNDTIAKRVMDSGAKEIVLGSIAVKSPESTLKIAESVGIENVIIGADVKGENVCFHGWEEASSHKVTTFISEYKTHGFSKFMCTDISKDGMLLGANTGLYSELVKKNQE